MQRISIALRVAPALGLAALLGACGSSSSKPASAASTTQQIQLTKTQPSGPPYHPEIVPADFTSTVTNRYWPVKPGNTWTFDGTKDGVPEHVVLVVTHTPRTVYGVKCVEIVDTVTVGGSLEEKTVDWYAQNKKTGAVWYFGENSKDYKNGAVSSTQGTWESGVDGALPGTIVEGSPKPGPTYRQEYRPGVAEDMAKVMTNTATETVPAGTFHSVVETYDTDPLNPDKKELKFFAPGVGLVHTVRIGGQHREEIKLVSYKKA